VKSYGPRIDPDGVVPHAAVSDALTYDRKIVLYTRHVGTGVIVCEQLRANKPGRRLVRLTATFTERDTEVTTICGATDELDEARALRRLEERMLTAQIQPTLETTLEHPGS
jgi:hypothetical protein